MIKILFIAILIPISVFSQNAKWITIKDTILHRDNPSKSDSVTRIYIDSLQIATNEIYITGYPLHEVSYWVYASFLGIDFDIAVTRNVMAKIRFKCSTYTYTVLQIQDGYGNEIPIKNYKNAWDYYFKVRTIRKKIWKYVCSYFN